MSPGKRRQVRLACRALAAAKSHLEQLRVLLQCHPEGELTAADVEALRTTLELERALLVAKA